MLRSLVVMLCAALFCGCGGVSSLAKIENQIKVEQEDGGEIVALASGTGFFVGRRGVLLTAAHVVQGRDKVFVYLSDRPLLPRQASVIAADYDLDIAVLHVPRVRVEPLTFCTSAVVGQRLVAHAWRRGAPERTEGPFYGLRRAGRWLARIMVGPGFSGGPVYSEDNDCVMGVVIESNMDSYEPWLVFTRPDSSALIMRVLRKWAPESIQGL